MHDPYAPPDTITRTVSEVQTDLDMAIDRLRGVGATPDEIEAFVAGWDVFDEDDETGQGWNPQTRAAWIRMNDTEIRRDLEATRIEYSIGTTTEEEAEQQERQAELRTIDEWAAGVIGSSVPRILAEVGDDVDKATALLKLETGQHGAERSTLVDPLAKIIESSL